MVVTMETDLISSKIETDQIGGGEEDDSKFSDDAVCKENLPLVESGSSSVLGSTGIISDEKKEIVQSIEMKPIVLEKTKVIKLLGVEIHVSTDSGYTMACNPTPLRVLSPNTVQFVPADPLDQCEGHVEDTEREPQTMLDDFSRLMQNIEARIGARPVLLYQKRLTKSDVSSNLNRLFINRRGELMGFLRDEERRRVEHNDKNVWLEVLATDPTGEMYELHLKLWRSLNVVVLNGKKWNAVVSRNKLAAGYLIELWAYREQYTGLCLAMNFKDPQ